MSRGLGDVYKRQTVENLQNERKIPYTNGTINPIVNAAIVGKAKIQNFFLIDFSITNIPFLKKYGVSDCHSPHFYYFLLTFREFYCSF